MGYIYFIAAVLAAFAAGVVLSAKVRAYVSAEARVLEADVKDEAAKLLK